MNVDTYMPVQPYIDSKGRLATVRQVLGKEYDDVPHTYPKLEPGERGLTVEQLRTRTSSSEIKYDALGMTG